MIASIYTELVQQYALWKWLSALVWIISVTVMLRATVFKIFLNVIQCKEKLYLNNTLERTKDEVCSTTLHEPSNSCDPHCSVSPPVTDVTCLLIYFSMALLQDYKYFCQFRKGTDFLKFSFSFHGKLIPYDNDLCQKIRTDDWLHPESLSSIQKNFSLASWYTV